MRTTRVRRTAITIAAVGSLLGLAACGGGAGEGGSSTITVSALVEQSGSIAYAGKAVEQGMQVGVDYVNSSGMLGGRTLELDIKDAASNPATAGAMASQVASGDSIAMLGPVLGNDSLAAAPLAQRAGLPMIAIQSNSPGVVETGDSIYRSTAPLYSYNGLTIQHLAKEGTKRVGVVYTSDLVGNTTLAKDYIPKWTTAAGMELVASESNPSTATDFSAAIANLVAAKPDAIGVIVIDTQLPAVVEGLRRAGYTGQLFTHSIAPATRTKVGPAVEGILWAADYSPSVIGGMSQIFTEAFRKKFGTDPQIYNANGFDAVLFVATALKDPAVTTREQLKTALAGVASSGFDAATGHVTFDQTQHRDARVPGVLVQWVNGAETIVAEGIPGLNEQLSTP